MVSIGIIENCFLSFVHVDLVKNMFVYFDNLENSSRFRKSMEG